MNFFKYLSDPLINENPVMVQILGLCSALAVSRSMEPALIMAMSVIAVLVFSNVVISLLRSVIPRSIRLILEVIIIASAVIVVDELIKTFAVEVSEYLSVFVGLIITNCIILGRAEAFALGHGPLDSFADALGNGLGYAFVILIVSAARELLGAGSLFNVNLLPLLEDGGWYRPNQLMLYAPSAFFLIGFLIWGVRSMHIFQVNKSTHRLPRHL
ncbi:MAG: NADH:ubiquinone reductase (Na(+)-transporting) subunit D [Pseudomonadales bacterium]|nr:NADH:ubiquinone reductase (Na(+)-transporting) subunit D [Pseudomonadales bacterium]